MIIRLSSVLIFLLSLVVCFGKESHKPNILFYLVDDMGVGDTSVPFFYEDGKPKRIPTNELYRTPHMEKLARIGTLY